jgi:trigger factor
MRMTEPETENGAHGLEVQIEEGEAWRRRLKIKVSPGRVASTRSMERDRLAQSVRLKGFRPGKIPTEIVEQRFGPAIDDRTVRRLVEDAYLEAIEDHDLHPVGDPEIGDVEYEEGSSLSFLAEFDVVPELRLERTGGFRIERPSVDASDEEVEQILERVRGEQAVWEPVERQPEEGDLVSVRIGPADGAESDSHAYRFELGSGQAIADVEEAIRTLAPGESGEFEVSFPDDFDDEELAGRRRTLRIELADVKRRELPPLDDELARSVGDFETLEALRTAVRDDVRRHAEQEAEDTVRQRILDSIAEANPFEVPGAMVEQYLDRIIQAPEEADAERVREARDQIYPGAERQIRRQLILDRLLEEGAYDATDEELEAKLAEMAERRGVEVQNLRRKLNREKQMERLRRQMAVDKLFEELEDRSEIR